ncbi:Trp biosynthesis-associated membrane protein [Propioniciclava soli]|uniref:Trp biosynthesis-associated membrane protein n=1 Tax=Propioniciclava soli TaxID=2775081 RepID=A0ABZ3C2H5_9ACTN|nr:Trp biosynthesis-associated membrane protein [Propioniciclava soli]
MRFTPRPALALCLVAAFGVALAPWWTLEWQGAVGSGTAAIDGATGTGGLAQVLVVAAAGGLLLTLTLRQAGRRVVGVLLGLLCAGIAAVGIAAFSPDAARLAATQPAATLATDVTATATVWPGVAAALGVFGVVAAGWLVARPMAARRRPDHEAPSLEVADSQASWKAMDSGIDPTQDGPGQEHS